MRKFQIFLIIESVLIALAFMTILSNDLTGFVLIVVLTLLALRFYNRDNRSNFFLTTSLLLFFLILMLNPYVISAIILGILYMIINHFSQVKQKNRYALIKFQERCLSSKPMANQWIGNNNHLNSSVYAFDDINIIRLSGTDTIDLSQVIVTNHDNIILIRKIYGPTLIKVPIDVGIKLDISSVYGSVSFLDFPEYDLRNETIKFQEKDYENSVKTVKIVISVIAGTVEVRRI
ncbi:cell wall-active antibiotics response protein LiaF [Streptococcus marimammalium]|uniref:cell wall-active antibiotics response protein LiaF n=1 Tax=Streptococcus marimammalium TaxID=269666 RepID=UPI00038087B6|nr:cell wall-active antibiotics response protein LiaF [Streptococcus marimammalium]